MKPARRLAIVSAAMLLLSCAEDSIAIDLLRLREDPDDSALLDMATALLGHSWHESDEARAVHLSLVDHTGDTDAQGVAVPDMKPCTKQLLSSRP